MIIYEIKKVFSKTGTKIAMLVLLFAIGVTCFFALDISFVDENGDTQSGPQAVHELRAAQKKWSGYLDENKIQMVITENLKIRNTPEALSQNIHELDIAYGWGQGIQEIRNLLNCSYAKGFREYDYYRADSLSETDAQYFYSNRISLLKEWLGNDASDQFSDNEKKYLIAQYENLSTPIFYDYMIGWKQLFEFAATIVMLIMLFLGYLVSGIFSNEFSWKSDAIFFSSYYGRNKGVSAKIKAGFFIVTAIYFVVFFLYTAVTLLYLGADGWNLPIQASSTSWKSFYNITNIQEYLLICLGGYVGCLFISFLSMLVSAKTRTSVLAVMVPVIIIFIPSFISNINTPILNKILGLLPDQLLQVKSALNYFNLYSIGGQIMGEIPILFTIYAILNLVLMPLLYQIYRHTQVS